MCGKCKYHFFIYFMAYCLCQLTVKLNVVLSSFVKNSRTKTYQIRLVSNVNAASFRSLHYGNEIIAFWCPMASAMISL